MNLHETSFRTNRHFTILVQNRVEFCFSLSRRAIEAKRAMGTRMTFLIIEISPGSSLSSSCVFSLKAIPFGDVIETRVQQSPRIFALTTGLKKNTDGPWQNTEAQ